jgi:hypothetical protein
MYASPASDGEVGDAVVVGPQDLGVAEDLVAERVEAAQGDADVGGRDPEGSFLNKFLSLREKLTHGFCWRLRIRHHPEKSKGNIHTYIVFKKVSILKAFNAKMINLSYDNNFQISNFYIGT